MPAYLRPSAPFAERAVLTGDPARAMMLAQELTEQPKMANHARGLWGYTGVAPDGEPLTVQSTGIGAPSGAAVIRDLAELGVRRAVRVGTCVAADPALEVGALLALKEATGQDGVSRSLGREGDALRPAIAFAGADGVIPARISSHDGEPQDDPLPAHDLQTAALLAVAEQLGIQLGALLIVARDGDGNVIGEDDLDDAA